MANEMKGTTFWYCFRIVVLPKDIIRDESFPVFAKYKKFGNGELDKLVI